MHQENLPGKRIFNVRVLKDDRWAFATWIE
jgi:hypothetical protein